MKQGVLIILAGLGLITLTLIVSPACALGAGVIDPGICSENSGCPSPLTYCEKTAGNCEGEGVCAERPTACPDVWAPVCGCDGNTYGNACEAASAGVSLDHEGECLLAYCWDNTMCEPSDYCFFKECALETGVCIPRPDACLDIWDPVCGCDGKTYSNACYAALAGVSLDYKGECRPTLCPGDINNDGKVDEEDIKGLAETLGSTGSENSAGFYPADINKDRDVDGEDLSVLTSDYGNLDCLVPRIASYGDSGCLLKTKFDPGVSYPGCGDDLVECNVAGHYMRIVHKNVTYNCCPEDIQTSLYVEGNVLRVVEEEIGGMCHCLCCYDVKTEIVVPPGEYVLEYCWQDYETGKECYKKIVPVP